MIDLADTISRVSACTLLSTSVAELLEGLAVQLETKSDPADLAAALRANTSTLAGALTRGTSHIAVDKDDPLIDTLRTALESPVKDRAAQIASVELAFNPARLEIAAVVADLQVRLDAMTTERHDWADRAERSESGLSEVTLLLDRERFMHIETTSLLALAKDVVAAKDLTIAVKTAQLETQTAQLAAKVSLDL